MAYYSVVYTYGPDLATQDENRPTHRAFLGSLAEQGKLVASGPLVGTSPAKALILMCGDSADEVRGWLSEDPFQQLGQVADVQVDEWNPVIGILAGK
ncbi:MULTISPECIES: YciI family protein [unclassified Luteococcus]|uniref:YciI family protein n=1 Tax=unclassified Luteococcus TaxID=2639923 RepID=UPI00313E38D7